MDKYRSEISECRRDIFAEEFVAAFAECFVAFVALYGLIVVSENPYTRHERGLAVLCLPFGTLEVTEYEIGRQAGGY